jgi:hypothetical protein
VKKEHHEMREKDEFRKTKRETTCRWFYHSKLTGAEGRGGRLSLRSRKGQHEDLKGSSSWPGK